MNVPVSYETLLVTGSVLAVLSMVAVLNAMIEGRRSRVARFSVLVAIGILVLAYLRSEDGIGWRDIPNAFVTVIAGFLK